MSTSPLEKAPTTPSVANESSRVELTGRRARARRLYAKFKTVLAFITYERVVWLALGIAGVVAFCRAAAVVGPRLWYEMQGPYNVDAPLYWTVGRGIVRGHVPWRDLFETKPPGIFLISALSYWLTGGFKLTNAGQVLAIALTALSPLAFLRPLFREPRRLAARIGIWFALASIVLVLTTYSAELACEVQTEMYGVGASVVYMLLVGREGRWAFAGRSLAVACAIGMKEPFLIALPAAYLILRQGRSRRDVADFWGPFLTAGALGTALLAALGWLGPFIKNYLSMMVGGHVKVAGSPFNRALLYENTWASLRDYSAFLPYALVYSFFFYVLATPPSERSDSNRILQRVQFVMLALLLALLAVGMGGSFYSHHYVIAVPVYLAVLYMLLSDLARGAERAWVGGIVAISCLLPNTVPGVPEHDFKSRAELLAAEDKKVRAHAQAIDALLDELKIDRYLWLGPGGYIPLPYTRHTPLGPMFFQQEVFFSGHYPDAFVKAFMHQLETAQLVVLAHHMSGPKQPEVSQYLARHFAPWKRTALPKGFPYTILVRSQHHGTEG